MILNYNIRKLISEKAGIPLNMSSQFELLSASIFNVTRKTLGVNTLKRLWGILPNVNPSKTTLTIIAEYLGYNDWNTLIQVSENGNSKITGADNTIFPKRLFSGSTFELHYNPNRELQLQVRSDKRCYVEKSVGGKIHEGDILDISDITIGNPLYVSNVEREGKMIGTYQGGINGGVKSIVFLNTNNC
jgi:hypothetical protein